MPTDNDNITHKAEVNYAQKLALSSSVWIISPGFQFDMSGDKKGLPAITVKPALVC